MPNIKKISSLRSYTAVLDEVAAGRPVMLERDGVGKYAILDTEEFDSPIAAENTINKIMKRVERLTRFPDSGVLLASVYG